MEGAPGAAEEAREDGDGGNEAAAVIDEEERKKHPTIVKTNGVDAKKETCTWTADEKKEDGNKEEKEALQPQQ